MKAVPILVIAGATAVGKTALGVELCERLGGELVGADSVQVYRGFDIGSSKPTAGELRGVRHHLLDVVGPEQAIDAARYAALADAAIADIAARGRVPVVVGGTGLWLRALLRGLLPLPPVDPVLRARLEDEWRRAGPAAMHARLEQVDPVSARQVHANDQVRVVRALEVHAQTGRPIGDLRAAHALGSPRYADTTLVLDVEQELHARKVSVRVQDMLERGFIDEVRGLRERYGSAVRPLQSVGYRQVIEHLEAGGAASSSAPVEAELAARIERATRLYAKRQRNWFRTDPSVDLRLTPEQACSPTLIANLRAALERD